MQNVIEDRNKSYDMTKVIKDLPITFIRLRKWCNDNNDIKQKPNSSNHDRYAMILRSHLNSHA